MSPPDCADDGHVEDIEQTYIPIDSITSPAKHEADYNTGYEAVNPDPNIISAADLKSIENSIANSSPYRTPECLDIDDTYCANELEAGAEDHGKWIPADEDPLQTYIDTGEFEKKTASGETKEGFRRGKPKKTAVSVQECYETVNNKQTTTSCIVIVLLVCIALSIGIVFIFRKVRKDSDSVTTQPQSAKR